MSTDSFEADFRCMPRERLSELHYFGYKLIKETEEQIRYLSPEGKSFVVDKNDPYPSVWFDHEVDMGQLAN